MRNRQALLAASLVFLLLGISAWGCGGVERAGEPTETPVATSVSLAGPTSTPQPTVSVTSITYVVQPGDTLADIAASYGTTAEAICALNQLEDCSLIYPGDELQIPAEAVVSPSPTKPALSPTVATTEVPPTTPTPLPSTPTQEAAFLPPPQDMGPVNAGGNAELRIDNDTPYVLTLDFQGPTSHTVSIERCPECKEYSIVGPISCPSGRPSVTFRLPPGTYKVTARVDKPGINPFAGTWELAGDRSYGYCFYIMTQFH